MKIKPTDKQREAIEKQGNVIVSAAAGSGKTAVLAERVINKIAPTDENAVPVPANRLLIVTFTNAAAKEMRGRIEKRLYETIKESPKAAELERQRRLIRSADICTIDSFCINLLRENFSGLGISPDFSVSNGDELNVRKQEILAEMMKPYFDSNDEVFCRLLKATGCNYDESNLCDTIKKLFDKAMIQPFPEVYLESLLKPYDTPFEAGNVWYDYAVNAASEKVNRMVECVAEIASNVPYTEKTEQKADIFSKEMAVFAEELLSAVNSGSYERIHEALLKPLPSAPRRNDNEAVRTIADLKDEFSDSLTFLRERLFECSLDEIEDDIKYFRPAVSLLIEFCKEYKKKLFDACLEENILTFAFCEQLLRELLCEYKDGKVIKKPIAYEISAKYDEVMVDEYQDVNDLQNMLFDILSDGGKKLFTVGDVKQSVYAFRGSNPDNFIKRKDISEQEDSDINGVILSENFRSSGGVCSAANFLFSALLQGQTGKIVYTKEEYLKPKIDFPKTEKPAAEFIFINNADDEKKNTENEAAAIVRYIESTVKEGKIIRTKDGVRQVCYGDFALLFRSLTEKSTEIIENIEAAGIPICYNTKDFLETPAVKLALSLLKVIDNPKSDVELLSVMMSPLFAFTPDNMAEIRKSRRVSLYSSVTEAAGEGNKKAAHLIDKIAGYRRNFAIMPLGEAIENLYTDTDLLNIVSVMPGGSSKRADLQLLGRMAESYGKSFTGGIHGFMTYLESLPETSFKGGKSAQNGVKIMSMHTSKGLQFPICILANLANEFNTQDSKSLTVYSEKYGMSFKRYDEATITDRNTVMRAVNSDVIKKNTVDEEIRLLYVAATRAEDRVCYVCSAKNLESTAKKLSGNMSKEEPYLSKDVLYSCNSMSQLVLAAVLLSKKAENLKKILDVECPVSDLELDAEITLIKGENIEPVTVAQKDGEHFIEDSGLTEEMKRNFAYSYPYEALRGIEAKVSVSSEANGEEAERFAFTSKPAFMLETGLSAAGRGTAMHHVMQFISFEDGVSVDDEMKRLVEWQFISPAEALVIDTDAIKKFFRSELMARIKASSDVRREMRFLSEMPAGELKQDTENLPENTGLLVQGAVDLCFTENDGITVLDFKTDRVKSTEVLKERYKEQLDIYGKACEKVMGMPVKEKIIYSFELSEYISFK